MSEQLPCPRTYETEDPASSGLVCCCLLLKSPGVEVILVRQEKL